jgi:hypothetical protein
MQTQIHGDLTSIIENIVFVWTPAASTLHVRLRSLDDFLHAVEGQLLDSLHVCDHISLPIAQRKSSACVTHFVGGVVERQHDLVFPLVRSIFHNEVVAS